MVTSKQGRDHGHHYVIVKTEDKCCFLADGRKAAVVKPKKKNYKHLQGTLTYSKEIGEKLILNQLPTDAEVREFLNNHWPKNGQKEE
ncbi:MAG: hypothetical protein RR385_02300 [Clostridiales bacterium]